MRRKPPRTVDGARPRPSPAQFGLPNHFCSAKYLRQVELYEAKVASNANWLTLIIFIASQVALYFIYDAYGFDTGLVVLTAVPPMCVGVIFAIHWFVKPRIASRVRRQFIASGWTEIAQYGLADQYIAALNDWEFSQTEAGLGYWHNLKSIDFELAVASFFKRRGGVVQMTKVTGDGGIDLVLKLGPATYWCQCKGHAKPVAVAAIRQIAGAALKSSGIARPVIFSTNGFTKPALDEAATLGVVCIDGWDMTQMATQKEITNL